MNGKLYARIWRWHFFAGLIVAPFLLILAVTGSCYLFKPQIEAAIDASIAQRIAPRAPISPDAQIEAMRQAFPRALLLSYWPGPLPKAEIETESGEKRLVWLDPAGGVAHSVKQSDRFMEIIRRIHGELFAGKYGSMIVEAVACWTIILLITGLFLWWPRGKTKGGALTPRLDAAPRTVRRDAHAVAAFWVFPLILTLLITGLPWTEVWGDYFTKARAALGAGGPRIESRSLPSDAQPLTLSDIAPRALAYNLPSPVIVRPPKGEDGVWTIRTGAQDRTKAETIQLDRFTGEERAHVTFADYNPTHATVMWMMALHEGQLFGWANQALGLLAAFGVIWIAGAGIFMWWRRRPNGALAAPPLPEDKRVAFGVVALILFFALFFPMVGATLIAALLAEHIWKLFSSAPKTAR